MLPGRCQSAGWVDQSSDGDRLWHLSCWRCGGELSRSPVRLIRTPGKAGTPPREEGLDMLAADRQPEEPTTISRQELAILVMVSVVQLMVIVDATIVNVALPSIQRALHFSRADLQWVI